MTKRPKDSNERGGASNERDTTITGPGASDFLTASGGLDVPEAGTGKGMAQTREEGPLADRKRLEPQLEVDDESKTKG